jgi:23S rRNA G2445 N2-methylase RlmL
MVGKHGYLRKHAAKALSQGLEGKFPASWRHAEESASVEFWLSIDGKTAVCGLRLSDRTMRHRTYKIEHRPASLRPTVAAAMVQLVEARPHEVVLDPMCGAGTILAEYLATTSSAAAHLPVWGGDIEMGAVRTAVANLRRVAPLWLDLGEAPQRRGAALFRWDALRLPLPGASIDVVMSNPPFGKQLGKEESLPSLYRGLARECDRVLRPGGRAVFLVGEAGVWRNALRGLKWSARQQVQIRILGQPAALSVWRKDA